MFWHVLLPAALAAFAFRADPGSCIHPVADGPTAFWSSLMSWTGLRSPRPVLQRP